MALSSKMLSILDRARAMGLVKDGTATEVAAAVMQTGLDKEVYIVGWPAGEAVPGYATAVAPVPGMTADELVYSCMRMDPDLICVVR